MKAWQVSWVVLAMLLSACGKHKDTGQTGQAAGESTATSSAVSVAAASSESAADPELARRQAAVSFALMEQQIKDDPKGQWAVSAMASSTYNDAKDQQSYSAWQATGIPNVERYGDVSESWASKDQDAGIEWLEVGFAKPVHASGIRIRQNLAPGAIIKVELLDDKKNRHTVAEGIDATHYEANTIAWYEKQFDATPYVVTGARITLASNAVPAWNEIDAVQLIGE